MTVGVSVSCMPTASIFYRTIFQPRLQTLIGKSSNIDNSGINLTPPTPRPKRRIMSMNHIDTYKTLDETRQEDQIPFNRDMELGSMKTVMSTTTSGGP